MSNKLGHELPESIIDSMAEKEYVTKLEHQIWVVKEWGRGIIGTLPLKRISKAIIIHLNNFLTMWLNGYPIKLSISSKSSPREMVNGTKLSTKMHCRAAFGGYCKVSNEPIPATYMQLCTHSAMYLGIFGSIQDSCYFFA